MRFSFCALFALAAATFGSVTLKSADAGGASRTITACSKYGSNCVTAKVRATRLGPQYLSAGGFWTWCEHDCVDTLRRDTVDFWDDQRERSK